MKDNSIKKIIPAVILAAAVCMPSDALAAFEFKGRGGRSAALGGAYTAVSDDVEAIWYNPAGLRLAGNIQIDTSYSALYGMTDLALLNAAAVVPTERAGTWGLGFSSFGFSDYKETDIRLAFSSALMDGIYFGTNLKSNSVAVGGEGGSGGVLAIDAGLMGVITEDYSIGLSAYNINRPRLLSDPSEYLEQRYMLGFYATPLEGVAVSLDLHKVLDREWEQRLGVEFPILRNFRLRAGVQSRPARFSAGFGAEAGIFALNYAFRTHQSLDSQHLFALQARFGEDTTRVRDAVPAEPEPVEAVRRDLIVNINTASAEELAAIPGLGPTVAGRIIEYRERTGDFRSVRDLMRVSGVTREMFNRFRDYMTVDEETSIEAPVTRPVREAPDIPDIGDIYDELYGDEPERPEPEPEPAPEPEPEPEPEPAPEPVRREPEPAPAAELINVNTADIAQLRDAGLPAGVARNLVRYRAARGDFGSWDELMNVPGMRASMVEDLKKAASLEPAR